MSKINETEIAKIRHELNQEYGVDMGTTGSLIVAIMRAEAQQQKATIDKASNRINQTNTSLQTDDAKATFWFGMGKSLPASLVALVIVGVLSFFYTRSQTYKRAEQLIASTKNAQAYTFLMREGQLVEGNSVGLGAGLFLKLSAPSDPNSIEAGRHFLQNKNSKIVYVPLRF